MEQMSDLFPLPAVVGAPLRITPHHCAKCGTGYAGPECGRVNGIGPASHRAQSQLYDADQEPAIIRDLLESIIGENVDREGLVETPKRVVKAWKAWTAGYHQDPAEVLKTFEDGAEGSSGQWVIVKDIPIYSHCEHHLAPFFGTATIGYVARDKVVGLSKLARLADIFAKRLQVQERLTNQIADALIDHLSADAAMVIVNCRHMCMESRGVARSGASTITQAFRWSGDGVSATMRRDQFYQQLKAI
jgi:GTP cyclohydrolase IA